MLSFVMPEGRIVTLTYNSSNQLTNVSDDFGRSIAINYGTSQQTTGGQIQSITDQSGNVWKYTYDSNLFLTGVTYPDGSGIAYHYLAGTSVESTYLTEVGDVSTSGTESDFLWFTYAEDQNATFYHVTSTYESENANNVSFSSNNDDTTNAVTITDTIDANTTQTRTLNFGVQANILKLTSTQGSCPVGECAASAMAYNTNGLPNSITDFNGNVQALTYDAAGLIATQVDAQGQSVQRTTNTTWDDNLRDPLLRTVSNAGGTVVSKTAWVYNSRGQTLARCEIDPSKAASYVCSNTDTAPTGVRRWTYTYCDAIGTGCPLIGLLLTETKPRTDLTQTTQYAYYTTSSATNCGTPGAACYQAGDLKTITDALGHVSTIVSYDGNGRVTRMTDPNGVNTDSTYTARGWLVSKTIGGAATNFTYTVDGSIATIKDPDNVTTTFSYDGAHRLTRVTDAIGNYVQYTLDADGNKTKEQTYTSSGTMTKQMSWKFNALDQLTAVIDGLNNTVFNAGFSNSYDANGNLVLSADSLSIQRQQTYDALNRLKSTLDNYNGTDTATANTTTATSQDALDRITSVTDPSGLVTNYTHDGLSNLTTLQSPDSGTSSSTFDAAGNALTHTDAKGTVATSTYDALDRKTSTTYTDTTANVTYFYDEANSVTGCATSAPIGRPTRMVEHAVSTTYCYDARGNVIQKTQGVSGTTDTTSYRYTAANRLSGETTSDGAVISYAFDSDGRISGVQVTPSGSTGASSTVVSNVTYLPFGPINSYTLGNGQTVTRAYDANYRLTDLTSPALALHFARDAMGDITALGNAPGANPATESYQYDPLYHLTSVSNSSGVLESYTYNPTGDRLSKTAPGLATGAYSYTSDTHQLASIGNAPRANDANGNATGSVIGGNTYGFAYDPRQRISLAQANGTTVGTYLYNALGQRVYTSASGLRFNYDQAGHVLANYGASSRDYVWLDDLPVATVDNTSSGSVTSSTIHYVVADHLATPRAVTNSAGTVVWSWAYQGNPFGEQQPTSSSSYVLNLRFPGQYHDVETGLMYNGARYYEPPTGRFPQPDPSGVEGGLGLYVYGLNNPLLYFDPDGLQAQPAPGPAPAPAPGLAPAPSTGPIPKYGPPVNDPVVEPEAPGVGGAIELCASNPILCVIGMAIFPTDAGGPQDELHPNVVPFPKTHRPIPNQCPVDDNGKEDRCAALYKSTLNTCASLTGKKRFMCLAAARENYKQCMEEE